MPAVFCLVFSLFFSVLHGKSGEFTLADALPPDVIACVVPPDSNAAENAFASSTFRRLAEMPEMAPFFQSLEESRRALAQDIAGTSGVSPEMAHEIISAKLGGALLNIGIDRDGKIRPEFLIALQMRFAPDKEQVFTAVRNALNRREVVRAALQSQGMDPNLPLKTLAQEETIPGYPPMLRIGPYLRVAVIDKMIILYNGTNSDGIRSIFDAAGNPAHSLAGTPLYQTVMQGAGAKPGMAFTFINMPRLMSILDAAGYSSITRVIDSLGLSSVQGVGLADGYEKDGMRHNLYVHHGGQDHGLLSALIPMPPNSPNGVEVYSQIIPAQAEAVVALRLDFQAFLEEAPYFAEAIGAVTRPGGMSGYLVNETLPGVPVRDIASVLGEDLVIRPHDDTQVAMFANVDFANFERVIAAMEQNAGTRFRVLDVGGYKVRYFNQRSDSTLPLSPAFCLIPKQQPQGRGVLYVASHPQAIVSLIREAATANAPLSQSEDYRLAVHGLESGYSLFCYVDCRQSYRRFYNFMLPMVSLWSSSSSYPVDTGLLPTAQSIMPGLFGCAFGIKVQPGGITLQAYSPIGINALFIHLADKLVINNPLVLGYVHSLAMEMRESLPW